MCNAQQVFDAAFNRVRSPRSEAYKLGVMACLRVRLDGVVHATKCPYPEGSAESDAYFAGVEEGRALSPVNKAPYGFDGPVAMTF